MSFEGANINKLNGGLGQEAPNTDRVMAAVIPIATADLPAGMVHYTPYKLLQVKDAETLGINASFDANKDLLFYHAITEFFRLAPAGELHIIVVPDTLTVTTLAASAQFKSALRLAKDVKGLAIAISADVTTQVANAEVAQGIITSFAGEYRLIDFIILPARGNAAAMTIADYPDLRTKVAPNVSLSIAQDPDIAALDVAHAKYADWGATLGMLAARKVNENLGSVNIINKPSARKGDPDYALTSTSRWLDASLSSGVKVNSLSAVDKKSLTAKGYIYAGSFDGYAGVFFNSSPTSVAFTSDYAYIERNCVWNKCARAIRQALIPEVKGVVKKDPVTGFIKTTTISRWTGKLNAALEKIQSADEISGFGVYINPKQVLSENSPLKVQATVVSDGIVHSFDVDLGLANSI